MKTVIIRAEVPDDFPVDDAHIFIEFATESDVCELSQSDEDYIEILPRPTDEEIVKFSKGRTESRAAQQCIEMGYEECRDKIFGEEQK